MRTLIHLVGIGALVFTGVAASAELYKWVDENGVTNYSSDPPPKGRTAKPIADDRVSVYTPAEEVTKALEAERHRRRPPPPPAGAGTPPPPPGSAPPAAAPAPPPSAAQVIAPPAPPSAAIAPNDPCLNSTDPNCYAPTIYDGLPVFVGRQRPPIAIQPKPPAPPPPAPRVNMRPPVNPSTGGFSAQ